MYLFTMNTVPGEQVGKGLRLSLHSEEAAGQKVGADSRFLRRDLVPLQEKQAGLLMGQLAARVCVIPIHRGRSDN